MKTKNDDRVEMSTGVVEIDGVPYVESRARALGPKGPIPKGKVLVSRTPILPGEPSEEEIRALTHEELIDDDSDEAFCPWCAEEMRRHGRVEVLERGILPGRNAPCPCGSGKKFKKCCLTKLERPISAYDIQ